MLRVKFSIVKDEYDVWPVPYEMPWDQLAQRLARHDVGPKAGSALVCGLFEGRSRASGAAQARQLVALDIETNLTTGVVPADPEAFCQLMAVERQACVVWTTHSHTKQEPRYRAVFPISAPVDISGELGRVIDKTIVELATFRARMSEVADRGKFGAESLFFLARHRQGAEHFSRVIDGTPFDAGRCYSDAFYTANQLAMRDAQLRAMREAHKFPEELRQMILAYNDGHEIADLLAHYGYSHHGDRWKSTYQSPSSTAATAIFPSGDGWYSWSMSDRDAGLGSPCDDGVYGDSFSLYVHFEHGNDFRRAIAALRAKAEGDR